MISAVTPFKREINPKNSKLLSSHIKTGFSFFSLTGLSATFGWYWETNSVGAPNNLRAIIPDFWPSIICGRMSFKISLTSSSDFPTKIGCFVTEWMYSLFLAVSSSIKFSISSFYQKARKKTAKNSQKLDFFIWKML